MADAYKETNDDSIGVVSFTTEDKSPVMWGHYGDSHKGIMLEFEISNLKLYEVKYRSTPHSVDSSGYNKYNDKNEWTEWICSNLLESMTTKVLSWKYEQEYRLIGKKGTVQSYEVKDLKGVYFGYYIQSSEVVNVMIALSNILDVKYYKSDLDLINGCMKYEEINSIEDFIGHINLK